MAIQLLRIMCPSLLQAAVRKNSKPSPPKGLFQTRNFSEVKIQNRLCSSNFTAAKTFALFSGCLVAFEGVMRYFLLLLVFLGRSPFVFIRLLFCGASVSFWDVPVAFGVITFCYYVVFSLGCPCCFWGVTFCYFWDLLYPTSFT